MTESKKIPGQEMPSPISPTPIEKGVPPRSRVYSEQKLRGDYEFFTNQSPTGKSLAEIQTELFNQARDKGDENQAFEFLLARKWDEFDTNDKGIISQYASPQGKRKWGKLWKLE